MKTYSQHIIEVENGKREIYPFNYLEFYVDNIQPYTQFEDSPEKIWESNIFGKSLSELVNEGLNNKLYRMPADARGKLQETLQRIINEGSGGLICIIL